MEPFRTNRVSCVSYFGLGQLSLFRHATVFRKVVLHSPLVEGSVPLSLQAELV